mgnify:CR=1 FL=1
MKIVFGTTLEAAPKIFTRVRLTDEKLGTKKSLKEDGVEWLCIGAGKGSEMNQRRFITLCRAIIRGAHAFGYKKIAVQFDRTPELFKNLQHLTPEDIASLSTQNFEMANYEFRAFKTRPGEGWREVEEVQVCGKSNLSIHNAVKKGQEIGRAINACRELANTPGSDMTPTLLAKASKKAAARLPIKVEVLTEADMKKLGMGLILGVSRGSTEPATFIVMEYKGAKGKPIVLAGKGITFDSGGLNLKSGDGHEMHMDMSGGAAVIQTVALAAKLKVKKHVIGLIPAVENMPSGSALRPHDIVRSLSGKTVEIMNTDAEGRLVLADAITYAKRFNPSVVVDVATLTGASLVALGMEASAFMTCDEEAAKVVSEVAEASGDYAWRLPLWDEYAYSLESSFADLANCVAGASGRYGGTINGGMFLNEFAKELDCPFVHIDMAPRMTATPREELAKGAAGAPVRLLYAFIEAWKS